MKRGRIYNNSKPYKSKATNVAISQQCNNKTIQPTGLQQDNPALYSTKVELHLSWAMAQKAAREIGHGAMGLKDQVTE